MKRLRVLLIDDCEPFLKQAARFLASEPDMEVVGVAPSVSEGVELARASQPSVVLLDQRLPGECGIDLVPRLREIVPAACIIMLTMHERSGYREWALQQGADGYVMKGRLLDDLLPEIQRLAGLSVVPRPDPSDAPRHRSRD